MPTNTTTPSIGQEVLNVPFPEMVKNLAMAIAEAQTALDMSSMRLAQFMAGYEEPDDPTTKGTSTKVKFGGTDYSLLELGFTPTFYQFVETVIEVKISISMSSETTDAWKSTDLSVEAGITKKPKGVGSMLKVSSVNASYSAKYQYQAEGSSVLRTKLVPVPVPSMLEERIRKFVEAEGQK
jgi:hypothetical protein